MIVCYSYNTPSQEVGEYKPENFGKFLPKVFPLTPVIIFEKVGFKNSSNNEYINEFVVILKLINFKNRKLKNENFKNSMVIKNSHSRINLFTNTPKKHSRRIIEVEPTK